MITLVNEAAAKIGVVEACDAIGLSRATFYRCRHGEVHGPKPKPKTPPRALRQDERQVVLDKLHEPRFVDASPTEVFAELLDEGEYLCSPRTMYRILSANDEIRERRRQTSHPPRIKPQLCATAPNQVWTWDISVPQKAAREMRVGPSQSACRSRLQTTVSGLGQKPWS